MNKAQISVIGIGPGSPEDITPAALDAMKRCDVVIGYRYYFQFIQSFLPPGTDCIDTGMKREKARAEQAFDLAEQGKSVCVISSGDAGIYGMVPLIYEMKRERNSGVEINVIPGISAFQKAAALLGAPMGHDFCVISLSDLMTPWARIEKRILAAAQADFVTAVYNPKSEERYWQLYRLKEIFLQERSAETPVGFVRQAGREEQTVTTTSLGLFDPEQIDMFTVVIIGNSQSYISDNKFITPRGYYKDEENTDAGIGQDIMIHSFRAIEKELKHPDIALDKKWALLHAIHTTADFEMENLLKIDDNAVSLLYEKISNGTIKSIITDVTMAAAGIRKGALQRLNVKVKCYLPDERTAALATEKNITRTQAGIRLAVEEHPDALYVFGNAPTALMELCSLIRKKKANPAGIIAAPVGFVHVCESKHMVKPFTDIPKLIIEGRKGGSNLAATLVNAILCLNDAALLRPGRDV
jgi:precorrin-3B C17-methyltransferase